MGCRCQAALLAVQAGQIYLDGVKVWQGMFFYPPMGKKVWHLEMVKVKVLIDITINYYNW